MIDELVAQIEARFGGLAERALRSRGDRGPRAVHRRQQGLPRARAGGAAGERVPPRGRRLRRAHASCSPRTADDPELRELLETSRERIERARGGDPPGDGRARPQRRQERDRRDPAGRRRRRGRAVGRRPVPDAHAVRRAARLLGRAAVDRRGHLHVRGQGRRRLLGVQVRGRHPSRPARARDRVAGADPHLDGDRRGAARRPRTSRSTSTRTISRSTCTAARGRAGSRSTRPTRRCGSRTSRPGSSSRCRTRSRSCRTASVRCGCCARGCTSGRWPSSRPSSPPRARRRSAPASVPRRSAPTTSARSGSRTTASTCSSTTSTRSCSGELDELTARAPGRREAAAAGGEGGCLTP